MGKKHMKIMKNKLSIYREKNHDMINFDWLMKTKCVMNPFDWLIKSWLNCSFSPLTFSKLRFWPPKKKNYKTAP